MKKRDLTDKQRDVLKYIYISIKDNNLPPTLREIAGNFGFSSLGTVKDHLKALAKKGYIKVQEHKSRAIELVRKNIFSIPIIGAVQAGLPTLAVEEIEDYLDLDSLVFTQDETFALRVKGDSMIEAGIFPDDLVLVRKQSVAQSGEIVVAIIGEEATVKRLKKYDDSFYLEPANPNYAPIAIDESVNIIGKVISVVRRF